MSIKPSTGQCVGLWLAEGSTNSNSEITFTNNNASLIRFFHNSLKKILTFENKPRIYVYSKSRTKGFKPLIPYLTHRFYIDVRANKPYFIYRVSGYTLVNKWNKLVGKTIGENNSYIDILQGFFAGEGNIKYIEKSQSRVIRIAQGKPNQLIEKILNYLKVKFSYYTSERSYVISGKANLEKLIKIDISKLHHEKNKKLIHMFSTYKQNHYPRGQLKDMLLKILKKEPRTSNELSKTFNRDISRITKVLIDLKKMHKVKNYRVGSLSYWTTEKNIIIISDRKRTILNILNQPKRTSEISKLMKVDPKSSFRRLKELEKLNLVRKNDGLWYKIPVDKEVITYRIRNRDR